MMANPLYYNINKIKAYFCKSLPESLAYVKTSRLVKLKIDYKIMILLRSPHFIRDAVMWLLFPLRAQQIFVAQKDTQIMVIQETSH